MFKNHKSKSIIVSFHRKTRLTVSMTSRMRFLAPLDHSLQNKKIKGISHNFSFSSKRHYIFCNGDEMCDAFLVDAVGVVMRNDKISIISLEKRGNILQESLNTNLMFAFIMTSSLAVCRLILRLTIV